MLGRLSQPKWLPVIAVLYLVLQACHQSAEPKLGVHVIDTKGNPVQKIVRFAGARRDLWRNKNCAGRALPAYTGENRSEILSNLTSAIQSIRSGDPMAADKSWFKAFTIARQSCFPLAFGQADYLFDIGKYSEAFKEYGQILFPHNLSAIDPGYEKGIPLLRLGLSEATQGAFDQAIRDWKEATTVTPGFQEAYFLMGNALYATGKKLDARTSWRMVLSTYGPAYPEEVNAGPSNVMASALRMYEMKH